MKLTKKVDRGVIMNDTFKLLKKSLTEEFEWLKKNYPLGEKMECHFHVFHEGEDATDDEVEINGFATYEFVNKFIQSDIFLMLDTKKRFDDLDHDVMAKFQIEKDYDLYFWMLYHEYGHIFDIKKIRKRSKLRIVKKKMTAYLNMTRKIRRKTDQGYITEKEGEELYRKLQPEMAADRFANVIYKNKKDVIKKYVERLNDFEKKGE